MDNGPLLPLDYAHELPQGLRLSTDCPCRRVREFYLPDAYPPFPPGLGRLGHMLCDDWIKHRIHGLYNYEAEVPIPWGVGFTSHIDVKIVDATQALPLDWHDLSNHCVEFKTTSERHPTPSDQNRRQVQRMIYAARRRGMSVEPFCIVMLDKKNYCQHGPWTIELPPYIEEQVADEFAEVGVCWDALRLLQGEQEFNGHLNDPRFMPDCRCGTCWEKAVFEPSVKLRELMAAYRVADEMGGPDGRRECKKIRELIDLEVPEGAEGITDGFITISKSRTKPNEPFVDWVEAHRAGVAKPEWIDHLAEHGYAGKRDKPGSLRIARVRAKAAA